MQDNLVYLGHVAVFYVPTKKLDRVELGDGRDTPRQLFHKFFMKNYNAYTLEEGGIRGYWREHVESEIFSDKNTRYEVSFEGRERVPAFVDFLSHMCSLLDEQMIYLTMGYQSWLVLPRRNVEVSTQIY